MHLRSVREQRTDCPAPYHDTYSAYQNVGCRCPAAREDWRLYYKRRRHGRAPILMVDATGVRRRIQALWCVGYTSGRIADETGLSRYHICDIVAKRGQVQAATHEVIADAYARLGDHDGPSEVTRRRARAAGYQPPEAWSDATIDDLDAQPYQWCREPYVDHVKVQRALHGRVTWGDLNDAERQAVWQQRGQRSMTELAHLLHCSGATIQALAATAGVAA